VTIEIEEAIARAEGVPEKLITRTAELRLRQHQGEDRLATLNKVSAKGFSHSPFITLTLKQ